MSKSLITDNDTFTISAEIFGGYQLILYITDKRTGDKWVYDKMLVCIKGHPRYVCESR